jgi:hypothetical protein
VPHRDWIEWTPNVIQVRADIEGKVGRIRLRSNTPNFGRYEMRPPGGRWQKAAAHFDLKLEGPGIERAFRSVNVAGVAGPVSRLVIEPE